jgi:Na+/H+ antiporter NhaA
MADPASTGPRWWGRSVWARDRTAPLRAFLRTEAGSSGVLVAATIAALVWANVDKSSYDTVWTTRLSLRLGHWGVTRDLLVWVNSGLMTLFFLTVGLEARREFDLGDLRERRRLVLPVLAGLVGMVIPVLIFLAINAGKASAHGWGVAMSTDTALALGLLTLVGRGVPDRMRVFLLTVFIVDDLLALLVIALVYSDTISLTPLIVAIAAFVVLVALRAAQVRRRSPLAVVGLVMWSALLASGVDPIVTGLVVGLSATAYAPARSELDRATGLFRLFREQPTPELARSAVIGVSQTLSPNERLQAFWHPWASFVIVPLFALANAGITINGRFLAHAYTTPITVGILVGYVVGKPIAVIGTAWMVTRISRGRLTLPVGWAAVTGSGTIAGIGFTVALLIANRAFHGQELDEAKLGALSAAAVAALITWVVFRATALLSPMRKVRALLGDADQLQDLIPPVDRERDHVRGPDAASVTVVEYGDFECPYCGQAEPAVRELLTEANVRYVWRHLPLPDVHPEAQLAAEAAEAAAAQGAFWPMHDLLFDRQDHLKPTDLIAYARELGLDEERFRTDLKRHSFAGRVAQDVESADLSGVAGTPTFFINGARHFGAYDIATLSEVVRTARARSVIRSFAATGEAPAS